MSKLHESEVRRLHPTQMTVGMIEVNDKVVALAQLNAAERKDYLLAHPVPAVEGPGDKLFITDHHHLARAMTDAHVTSAFFQLEEDFSSMPPGAFWIEMDRRNWVHPYDQDGKKRTVADIPGTVGALVDDPYRSLAGYVRHRGGYAKSTEAFAEFLWADFFRTRISIGPGRDAFLLAVDRAVVLARTPAAKHLPGYGSG